MKQSVFSIALLSFLSLFISCDSGKDPRSEANESITEEVTKETEQDIEIKEVTPREAKPNKPICYTCKEDDSEEMIEICKTGDKEIRITHYSESIPKEESTKTEKYAENIYDHIALLEEEGWKCKR